MRPVICPQGESSKGSPSCSSAKVRRVRCPRGDGVAANATKGRGGRAAYYGTKSSRRSKTVTSWSATSGRKVAFLAMRVSGSKKLMISPCTPICHYKHTTRSQCAGWVLSVLQQSRYTRTMFIRCPHGFAPQNAVCPKVARLPRLTASSSVRSSVHAVKCFISCARCPILLFRIVNHIPQSARPS